MAETPPVTNLDLMNKMIEIAEQHAADRVMLVTLVDSHRQRVQKADAREQRVDRRLEEIQQTATAARLKVDQVQRDVAVMRPVVKRMRLRAVWRRGVVECFGRWWGLITTLAVSVGGLIAVFSDSLPKLANIRKFFGGG